MNFTEMTRDQLRQVCRENGLKVGGRKAELLERVQNHFAVDESTENEVLTSDTEVNEIQSIEPEVAIADQEQAIEPQQELVTVAPVKNPEPLAHKIILTVFALVAIAIELFILTCEGVYKLGEICGHIHRYCKPVAIQHSLAIVDFWNDDIHPWVASKVETLIEETVYSTVMATLN